MPSPGVAIGEDLREWWSHRTAGSEIDTARPHQAHDLIAGFVADHLDDLPLPGAGETLTRFDALTAIGELDLTVGRLLEAHVDALAIIAELDADCRSHLAPDAIWGVWAAEPPSIRLDAQRDAFGTWTLSGRKAWCSGAGIATAALVTAHAPDGSRLFAVDLEQSSVVADDDRWPTTALSGTDTRSVDFHAAAALPVGDPDGYIERPGFWYGAAGVAAVWLGGARAIAGLLEATARQRDLGDLGAAHLGAVTAALAAGAAVLRDTALAIDGGVVAKPPSGEIKARSARAVVEDSATRVIDHVGRALGPAPLATNLIHARRVADLQLYLRQSHAERDLAALGRRVIEADPS